MDAWSQTRTTSSNWCWFRQHHPCSAIHRSHRPRVTLTQRPNAHAGTGAHYWCTLQHPHETGASINQHVKRLGFEPVFLLLAEQNIRRAAGGFQNRPLLQNETVAKLDGVRVLARLCQCLSNLWGQGILPVLDHWSQIAKPAPLVVWWIDMPTLYQVS